MAAESLAVFATLIILQGGIQQIRKIWQAKCTGALSLPMTLVFFAKDVSNVFFGIVLGLELGWPLILMGAVSGILKLGVTITFLLYPEKLETEARVGYH
ncbi:PQ-loop domain-containing transporter [Halomonas sp. PA16-9]|uniref:PQ-loop domain-containing transporter n=1 Tax=Halomonas sp. PA16-9 TaxID=2576841 RepID=UPI0018C7A193